MDTPPVDSPGPAPTATTHSPLRLWYRRPAREWTEALPLGNGRLGAMVFGGIERERLQLNEDTLWAGGPYAPNNPKALAALPDVRQLVFAGRYREAHDLAEASLMGEPRRQMPYETAGELRLAFSLGGGADDYERELDLDTAIARTRLIAGGVVYERRVLASAVASAVLERGDGFDIMLMNNREIKKPSNEQRKAEAAQKPGWQFNGSAYGKACFVVAVSSLVAWGAAHLIAASFLPYLYMIAILLVVLDLGLEYSIFATFFSFISLDLLMTRPHFAIFPHNREDSMALLFFLAVALTISLIGDYLHQQIKSTRRHAERTQSLYDFTKSIAAAATVDDVAQATVRRVAMALDGCTAILLPRQERLDIIAAVPADLKLDTASNAAMDWAWQHGKPAGFRSDTLPGAVFYGLPLLAGSKTVGVLAVRTESGEALSSDQKLIFFPALLIRRHRPSNARALSPMWHRPACKPKRKSCAPVFYPQSVMIYARRSTASS